MSRITQDLSSGVLVSSSALVLQVHTYLQYLHYLHYLQDPGVMSEAETSSTRRKPTKPKVVLPVVRTTSKTLERPLGLVMDLKYIYCI